MGGPNGGDGGKGGDVWLVADHNVASLLAFRDHPHRRATTASTARARTYTAGAGRTSRSWCPRARSSTTCTRARCWPSCCTTATGGSPPPAGGAAAATPGSSPTSRRAPEFAEQGEHGEERWLKLELQLIADVALVGFPNVGKSTLISVISAARPKIADYPFTTLEPNLGVVRVDDDDRLRGRRHPRADRGRQRGPGTGPPLPAARRAGPGAVRPRRPGRARRHQPGRAGAVLLDELRRLPPGAARPTRASSSARRPTSRRPPIRPSSGSHPTVTTGSSSPP